MDRGETMRVITDGNLGRLARWLRALGCDAVVHGGRADRFLLLRALREDRVVLTMSRRLAERPFRGRLVRIAAERWEEQLTEAAEALGLHCDDRTVLGRCLDCNAPLLDAGRDEVRDRVPAYVLATQETFWRCARCGRVFWAGSHAERMLRIMRSRTPSRLP
jgi:uncharacterized protein with PIN domain